MKVGEVQKVKWYQFKGDPHYYSFHIAYPEGDRDNGVILRSDESTWPSTVAEANGVPYVFMRNATNVEVDEWLESHGELVVENIKEI